MTAVSHGKKNWREEEEKEEDCCIWGAGKTLECIAHLLQRVRSTMGARERDGDQKHADPTVPNRMIEAVESHQ